MASTTVKLHSQGQAAARHSGPPPSLHARPLWGKEEPGATPDRKGPEGAMATTTKPQARESAMKGSNPFDTLMTMAGGACLPRCLHVVADLGVADALDDEPK